ncbi:hypothetical protein Asppvi_011378 [Aspergillus pseudoviridinutans]|uniref:Methyltransferase domain-containing protein n=1 Tax=Aspergillus pseudoviridinutans TaxID=1517512 RepID=A0A9P3EXW2_9EURO|nr:uncharacterized protein Asppvi_011378 [Aspergillus pseudoviridinutans]GIJ92396.1 hypothetical protein Asppvi_011378 [Aspergillus pseudoviridinutans]
MVLFPRYHLIEVGDQAWCPGWLLAYLQSYLTEIWSLHIPGFSKTSPAGVACNIINRNLPDASSFTFVDLCAGAGGPIPVLDSALNKNLQAEGDGPSLFILSDLHPRLEEWQAIAKSHDNISYIKEPLDATKCERVAPPGRKECRIFNLCFHHFQDDEASAILGSALDSADAFMYALHESLFQSIALFVYPQYE